jgi:hypothetical protein
MSLKAENIDTAYTEEATTENDNEEQTNYTPFWSENPNVLFHKDHVLEFFPTEDMNLSQKLNALSRLVFILTIVSFAYTQSMYVLFVGVVSFGFIYLMHTYKQKTKESFDGLSEPVADLLDIPEKPLDVFEKSTPENPFSNVLVSDYLYKPNRKPAPPAHNATVANDILENAKQMVLNNNPGNEDLAGKLFKDLGDAYLFEQSLQPFYSTASTTIPNDQEAFSQFCYGSMISCKEGNPFACAKNNAGKYNNY